MSNTLPDLSRLRLTEPIGVRKRSREDDEVQRLLDNPRYTKLIEEIIQQLAPLPSRFNALSNCASDDYTLEALAREDLARSTILDTVKKSDFFPQQSSGIRLETPIQTDVAENIASLFFRATDALRHTDVAAGVDVADFGSKRTKLLMKNNIGTDLGNQVWESFAADGVSALKVQYGVSLEPTDVVIFRLSMQRADEATYNSRAADIHMDSGQGSKLVASYGLPVDDDNRSFVASFCAQRVDTSGSNGTQISILDCGTIIYKNVPVVTTEKIAEIAKNLSLEDKFGPCDDIEKVVSQVAANFNAATIASLKQYNDVDLARMGITKTDESAMTWVNTHAHNFHRSPIYTDIRWINPQAQYNRFVRSILQWVQRMTTSDAARDSQMRFFARMIVSKQRIPAMNSSAHYYEGEVDGVKVQVEVSLGN